MRSRLLSLAAVVLGLTGVGAAQTSAEAGEMLMYNFSTFGTHPIVNVFQADSQPVGFTQTDSFGNDHTVYASSGRGNPTAGNDTPMVQALTGLGSCFDLGGPLNPLCYQVDSVGPFDFLRVHLPETTEIVKSAIFGIVTPLGSDPDTITVLGANIPDPDITGTDVDLLFSGEIADLPGAMDLGEEFFLGEAFWEVPLNIVGYEYLFFFNGTNNNDGYSLLQLSVRVPEPGILALFGFGLAGLGIARRRKAG